MHGRAIWANGTRGWRRSNARRSSWPVVPEHRRWTAGKGGEPAAWADRLVAQVRAWRAELAAVAPWIGAVRSCDRQADDRLAHGERAQSWATIRTELLTPTSLAASTGRFDG